MFHYWDRSTGTALPNKIKQKITLIGSTGLIGSHFLEEISSDDYQSVNAITRRRISNLKNKNLIKQSVHDIIMNAIETVLRSGMELTPDMGGKCKTEDLGKALAAAV